MSKYHVEEIFRQFPWLKTHFPNGERLFQDGKVGRFDFELLSRKAGYWSADMHGSGHKRIFLFSSDGTLIGNVDPKRPWISYVMEGSWERRVDDALIQLGDVAQEVSFAFEVSTNSFTIYKPLLHYPPHTLIEMVIERRKAEQTKFKQEVSN